MVAVRTVQLADLVALLKVLLADVAGFVLVALEGLHLEPSKLLVCGPLLLLFFLSEEEDVVDENGGLESEGPRLRLGGSVNLELLRVLLVW